MLLAIASLLVLKTGNITPARLECEAAVNPMGIDIPRPELSWVVESRVQHAGQSAYRIRVATSAERLSHPDLWDSQRVETSRTSHIQYSGKPLKSAVKVYWNVQVWDYKGFASPPSKPSTWTMNLLSPRDWKAQWIGAGPRTPSNPYITFYLRKSFAMAQKPVRALAFVSGLGQYELRINGKRVGKDWLSPAWTQYQKTCIADEYDVTDKFQAGVNSIGMLVGNGMYDMSGDTRGGQQTNRVGDLKAICQVQMQFADGMFRTVGTDTTWHWHPSPATYSGVFGGEDWDARNDEPGWSSTNFDDSKWAKAVAMPKPEGELRGFTHTGPPLRTIEIRKPIKTTEPKANIVVFDLGQNAPYVPELTARGPTGSSISLWPAEQLYPNGLADQRTMRPGKHVTYILRGSGLETWHPAFWYCGSRYWQAEARDADGKPIDPRRLLQGFQGFMIFCSAQATGEFECSNPLLNQIHDMIRWSIRSNLSHVITDCPHREKSGWLEQDHLMGPGLMYTYDMRRIFAKTVNDMEDAQHPDGRIPTMAPEYFFYSDGFADSVEWGASIGLVPELIDAWYGYGVDDGVRSRAARLRYIEYLATKANNYILSNGLGDWNGGGSDPRTPVALTDTAYFYRLCHGYDGRFSQGTSTLELENNLYRAFNSKFFDPVTAKYATGSQSCQATALDLGLVPPQFEQRVFDQLLNDIAAQGYVVSCGEVGHPSLLHVLAAHGRSDIIAKIHLQTDKPGYGYQLKKGLTTLAESWDAAPISLNHFMLGQLLEWEYGDLVGIKPGPNGQGFKFALIEPSPVKDVSWTRASYDSCFGKYTVSWHISDGKFILDVNVPVNCSAHVRLPYGDHARGLKLARDDVNHLMVISSGKHHIEEAIPPSAR